MSALGAFFRGAAGPGMLALADSYERRDAEEAKRAERAAAQAAEQAFRAEQAGKDRMARYGTDGSEPGMLAAGRRSSAGGGGESGGGNINQAVADYARDNKVSMAQAQADLQASLTGIPNRTKQTVTNDADLDGRDRRTGTGQTTRTDPDEERMAKVWAAAGKAFSEAGPRAKSNFEQLKKGEQIEFGTDAGRAAVARPEAAGRLGQGVAVAEGKPLFNDGDNQYTGMLGAKTQSEIRENDASAGASGRSNRDGGKDGGPMAKLPEAAKMQIAALDKERQELQSKLDAAVLDGSAAGKDGAERPEIADMRKRVQGFEIRKMRVLADNGAIDAKAYAQQVLDGESDPAKLRAAITQAKQIGGRFAADFVPEVQARLAELDKKPAPTQADARKGDAAPAKPAAAPAAPTSGRAQVLAQSANRNKAEADPEVRALRQQIAAATSGRQANSLQSKLNDILASRYGL